MMVVKNSLQSQAYNTLKEQILSNILTPGTLYSETRISKELGISRTPMREALQCLSQDGYITIIPSRGFMIRQLSRESMRESIQIRCAIEGFCVHLIASQPSEKRCQKLLKDMERSLARQKKALDSPNTRNSFIEEDHRFHLLLVHYADNDEFSHLFQRLMYMIHLTTANALAIDGRAQATYDEHEELYRSLKDEDGDKAYRILIAHLLMPLNRDLL